jgi:hypothetical protein
VAGVDESTVEQALDDGDKARLVAEIVTRESPAQKPGAVERFAKSPRRKRKLSLDEKIEVLQSKEQPAGEQQSKPTAAPSTASKANKANKGSGNPKATSGDPSPPAAAGATTTNRPQAAKLPWDGVGDLTTGEGVKGRRGFELRKQYQARLKMEDAGGGGGGGGQSNKKGASAKKPASARKQPRKPRESAAAKQKATPDKTREPKAAAATPQGQTTATSSPNASGMSREERRARTAAKKAAAAAAAK